MKAHIMLITALPLCVATASAQSAERQQPRAEIFTDLLKCREIKEDSARLGCYDRQVSAMDNAAQRDEVVVLDKTELNKTRRSLFGFTLPKLPFLTGGEEGKEGKEGEEFNHIEAKIAAVRSAGNGTWQITLEDGAQWMTTEATTGRQPKAGQMIEIHRATMGSFMGKVEGGRAVRMKRVG